MTTDEQHGILVALQILKAKYNTIIHADLSTDEREIIGKLIHNNTTFGECAMLLHETEIPDELLNTVGDPNDENHGKEIADVFVAATIGQLIDAIQNAVYGL